MKQLRCARLLSSYCIDQCSRSQNVHRPLQVVGQHVQTHFCSHSSAHVTVSLTGAKLKVTTPDGQVSFPQIPPGHVFFAEAETHSAEIVGGSGTRSYIIELKGKGWKPSTG